MNTLKPERKAAVIRALVEGNSIRSTVRMTGVAKNTIVRLLVEIGEACSVYQDEAIKNVRANYVECDEIWSFVGCKAKNCTPEKAAEGQGDVWTWTAIDAESKLVISWYVGDRGGWSARIFIKDVARRLANRVQLTTDGHKAYLTAVERTFGADIDFGQLVKIYGNDPTEEKRYSPAVCTAAVKTPITGNPDEKHISTSFVERSNLTTRMSIRRFTRLTNAFSKKLANHVAAISLHFMYYNFARPHTTLTKNHPNRYPTTPAMAAGIADHVWSVEEIIGLISK